MAVTIVGVTAGTSGSATSTSFAPTLPAGWAAGDQALLVESISGGTLSGSPSAGWTAPAGPTWPAQEASASRMYAWTRTLQVGDSAPTLTNSGSVTGTWILVVVRGGTGVAQAATATASGISVTLPTLPGVAAGSALLAVAHCRVASGTIPTDLTWAAGYTELVDQATSRATSSANLRSAAVYRVTATSGSHGGETVTSDVTGSMIGLLVEVPSAAGVAPDGVTVPAAVGEPSVDVSLLVAPDGLTVPVALGAPDVSWAGGAAPAGLVVPVAVGEPAVDLPQTVTPDGLTVPVEVGAPAVQQHGGTVVRPAAGTVTRPGGPLVVRPDTGVVVRP
ncbi:hypothetical protein [Micromonospora carbonacea]|uniref:hypothetical protein n=1 Tax=Micromonospora carbonacea TaxID=47853 RepID=UPI003721A5E4